MATHGVRVLLALVAALGGAPAAVALDPPHYPGNSIECMTCHVPHGALGASLLAGPGETVESLCLSCHMPGGQASARPFSPTDMAVPGFIGTSHRWDSGPSGHVQPGGGNTSTGRVASGGVFTGRIEKTYTLTIVTAGDSGDAVFSWSDGEGNGGIDTAAADLVFVDGLKLAFANGTATPSFVEGDTWTLRVRTDLRLPNSADTAYERAMWQRLRRPVGAPGGPTGDYAKVVCTVCHDPHDQEEAPFDPAAPAWSGPGTGEGRHFQRRDNAANRMCRTCHSARDVQDADLGSHPVGVGIPPGEFQHPAELPLDATSQVQCMSCHAPHYATSGGANGGAGDGYLLRQSTGDLCFQCHTLADRTGGAHFSATTGALWPGGQYGSTFPAHDASKRGQCINCHWPHGWPDDATPAADYPRLWVERYDADKVNAGADPADAEDLCYTCHDGAPAATNIRAEFQKGSNGANIFHHPVNDTEQSGDRVAECVLCHNPHRATHDDKLAGVAGVDLAGQPVGHGTSNDRPIAQFELCFKCHGDTFNTGRPNTSNKRLDFQPTNSAYHPVAAAGKNQSSNLANALIGGLTTASTITCTDCHNNEQTANATGPASNSNAEPKGPHGSTFPAIRRANYWVTPLTGPTSYTRNNFQLCFLCHDPVRLVERRRFSDGASTNFYDDIDGKANLHWVHLVDRISSSRAVCKNCHYNIHSNQSADNTQYRVNGTLFQSPPPGFKTHLVNFSPDITPFGGRAKPEWNINTTTRTRQCFLACHGTTMEGSNRKHHYRPNNGGDDVPTIP